VAPVFRTLAVLVLLGGIALLVNRELNQNRADAGEAIEPAAVELAKVDIDVSKLPGPRKEYTPQQVVQVVMDALQNNDDKDSGIATCFNFASPGNKKLTGPLEHFIPMVKTAAYQPMLNFKSVDYDEAKIEDDHAEQLVTVTTSKGDIAMYVFQLSKQKDGDSKDCWMTDGVIRVQPKGKPA
jgi:hypothetical protein